MSIVSLEKKRKDITIVFVNKGNILFEDVVKYEVNTDAHFHPTVDIEQRCGIKYVINFSQVEYMYEEGVKEPTSKRKKV